MASLAARSAPAPSNLAASQLQPRPVGNGKLSVVVQAADASLQCEAELLTNDGLYDSAWSELHEHQMVGACGNGTIKL